MLMLKQQFLIKYVCCADLGSIHQRHDYNVAYPVKRLDFIVVTHKLASCMATK